MKIKLQTKPPRIEMIPLIDIVFLLLVVFIYSMLSMAVHKALPVSLPASSQARPDSSSDREAPLSVTVAADGAVYLDREPVAISDLGAELRRRAGDDTQTPVRLFADRRLTYQDLFMVLDLIRRAGFARIDMQADPTGGRP